MALVLKNRVKSTTTTTGTGDITLGGAATGYQDFSSVGNGNETYYTVKSATEWEVGKGTYAYGWSSFFDGTGDYLTVNDDAAFEMDGDFTIEAWFYATSAPNSYQGIITKAASGVFSPYSIYVRNSLAVEFLSSTTGSSWDLALNVNIGTATLNSWNHVAVSRSGTTIRLFLNGVLGNTITNGTALANNARKVTIGGRDDGTELFYGYISNARIIKGSAAYTAAFTPSTSQLTAVSGTSLLTCQSKTHIDNSTNQFAITKVGDASVSSFIPFTDTSNAILYRDTVFSSSNSGSLVNFSSGTKDVMCVYPSAAMPGGVPYADAGDVATDLSGWRMFQASLNNGVAADVTFNNRGTNGIVSTYALIATPGYRGGVLAPNGDIHFAPYMTSAPRVGQKVSATGVVSTYSLVYTTSQAYIGGVLAPNGDIHFIPASAGRGQKVNSSGVVSTYSLAYTTDAAYHGGVLDPNGDIHFVPYNAAVGQKISAAGVVSTYSLVYTTSLAYFGGVLAPNGDIHFIPYSADRGQKISAAGVVSTYSLVYTISASGYAGGVLAPNGDIHFVPLAAVVGQKISAAGVVSTYSLVYTTFAAYQGGVLSPSGDIHFIRQSASVGQKISSAGVVSTYSLVFTGASYWGGVLAPNGEIHFIPSSSTIIGQKISTNSGNPLGIGVCLSPFLNKL